MLGEKIYSLRKQNGMTQEQLAERLAITRQTISKWELGESEPDVASLVQISEIFQVTTDHLLKDAPAAPSAADAPPVVFSAIQRERAPGKIAKLLIGSLFTLFGFLGFLTIWALSIIRPAQHGFLHWDGTETVYIGLQGFLHRWNAWGLYWFTIAIGLIGLVIIFFPLPGNNKKRS